MDGQPAALIAQMREQAHWADNVLGDFDNTHGLQRTQPSAEWLEAALSAVEPASWRSAHAASTVDGPATRERQALIRGLRELYRHETGWDAPPGGEWDVATAAIEYYGRSEPRVDVVIAAGLCWAWAGSVEPRSADTERLMHAMLLGQKAEHPDTWNAPPTIARRLVRIMNWLPPGLVRTESLTTSGASAAVPGWAHASPVRCFDWVTLKMPTEEERKTDGETGQRALKSSLAAGLYDNPIRQLYASKYPELDVRIEDGPFVGSRAVLGRSIGPFSQAGFGVDYPLAVVGASKSPEHRAAVDSFFLPDGASPYDQDGLPAEPEPSQRIHSSDLTVSALAILADPPVPHEEYAPVLQGAFGQLLVAGALALLGPTFVEDSLSQVVGAVISECTSLHGIARRCPSLAVHDIIHLTPGRTGASWEFWAVEVKSGRPQALARTVEDHKLFHIACRFGPQAAAARVRLPEGQACRLEPLLCLATTAHDPLHPEYQTWAECQLARLDRGVDAAAWQETGRLPAGDPALMQGPGGAMLVPKMIGRVASLQRACPRAASDYERRVAEAQSRVMRTCSAWDTTVPADERAAIRDSYMQGVASQAPRGQQYAPLDLEIVAAAHKVAGRTLADPRQCVPLLPLVLGSGSTDGAIRDLVACIPDQEQAAAIQGLGISMSDFHAELASGFTGSSLLNVIGLDGDDGGVASVLCMRNAAIVSTKHSAFAAVRAIFARSRIPGFRKIKTWLADPFLDPGRAEGHGRGPWDETVVEDFLRSAEALRASGQAIIDSGEAAVPAVITEALSYQPAEGRAHLELTVAQIHAVARDPICQALVAILRLSRTILSFATGKPAPGTLAVIPAGPGAAVFVGPRDDHGDVVMRIVLPAADARQRLWEEVLGASLLPAPGGRQITSLAIVDRRTFGCIPRSVGAALAVVATALLGLRGPQPGFEWRCADPGVTSLGATLYFSMVTRVDQGSWRVAKHLTRVATAPVYDKAVAGRPERLTGAILGVAARQARVAVGACSVADLEAVAASLESSQYIGMGASVDRTVGRGHSANRGGEDLTSLVAHARVAMTEARDAKERQRPKGLLEERFWRFRPVHPTTRIALIEADARFAGPGTKFGTVTHDRRPEDPLFTGTAYERASYQESAALGGLAGDPGGDGPLVSGLWSRSLAPGLSEGGIIPTVDEAYEIGAAEGAGLMPPGAGWMIPPPEIYAPRAPISEALGRRAHPADMGKAGSGMAFMGPETNRAAIYAAMYRRCAVVLGVTPRSCADLMWLAWDYCQREHRMYGAATKEPLLTFLAMMHKIGEEKPRVIGKNGPVLEVPNKAAQEALTRVHGELISAGGAGPRHMHDGFNEALSRFRTGPVLHADVRGNAHTDALVGMDVSNRPLMSSLGLTHHEIPTVVYATLGPGLADCGRPLAMRPVGNCIPVLLELDFEKYQPGSCAQSTILERAWSTALEADPTGRAAAIIAATNASGPAYASKVLTGALVSMLEAEHRRHGHATNLARLEGGDGHEKLSTELVDTLALNVLHSGLRAGSGGMLPGRLVMRSDPLVQGVGNQSSSIADIIGMRHCHASQVAQQARTHYTVTPSVGPATDGEWGALTLPDAGHLSLNADDGAYVGTYPLPVFGAAAIAGRRANEAKTAVTPAVGDLVAFIIEFCSRDDRLNGGLESSPWSQHYEGAPTMRSTIGGLVIHPPGNSKGGTGGLTPSDQRVNTAAQIGHLAAEALCQSQSGVAACPLTCVPPMASEGSMSLRAGTLLQAQAMPLSVAAAGDATAAQRAGMVWRALVLSVARGARTGRQTETVLPDGTSAWLPAGMGPGQVRQSASSRSQPRAATYTASFALGPSAARTERNMGPRSIAEQVHQAESHLCRSANGPATYESPAEVSRRERQIIWSGACFANGIVGVDRADLVAVINTRRANMRNQIANGVVGSQTLTADKIGRPARELASRGHLATPFLQVRDSRDPGGSSALINPDVFTRARRAGGLETPFPPASLQYFLNLLAEAAGVTVSDLTQDGSNLRSDRLPGRIQPTGDGGPDAAPTTARIASVVKGAVCLHAPSQPKPAFAEQTAMAHLSRYLQLVLSMSHDVASVAIGRAEPGHDVTEEVAVDAELPVVRATLGELMRAIANTDASYLLRSWASSLVRLAGSPNALLEMVRSGRFGLTATSKLQADAEVGPAGRPRRTLRALQAVEHPGSGAVYRPRYKLRDKSAAGTAAAGLRKIDGSDRAPVGPEALGPARAWAARTIVALQARLEEVGIRLVYVNKDTMTSVSQARRVADANGPAAPALAEKRDGSQLVALEYEHLDKGGRSARVVAMLPALNRTHGCQLPQTQLARLGDTLPDNKLAVALSLLGPCCPAGTPLADVLGGSTMEVQRAQVVMSGQCQVWYEMGELRCEESVFFAQLRAHITAGGHGQTAVGNAAWSVCQASALWRLWAGAGQGEPNFVALAWYTGKASDAPSLAPAAGRVLFDREHEGAWHRPYVIGCVPSPMHGPGVLICGQTTRTPGCMRWRGQATIPRANAHPKITAVGAVVHTWPPSLATLSLEPGALGVGDAWGDCRGVLWTGSEHPASAFQNLDQVKIASGPMPLRVAGPSMTHGLGRATGPGTLAYAHSEFSPEWLLSDRAIAGEIRLEAATQADGLVLTTPELDVLIYRTARQLGRADYFMHADVNLGHASRDMTGKARNRLGTYESRNEYGRETDPWEAGAAGVVVTFPPSMGRKMAGITCLGRRHFRAGAGDFDDDERPGLEDDDFNLGRGEY